MKRTYVLSLILAAGLPISARATILDWLSASSGSASIASNWNPAQVPTAADTMRFNVGGVTTSAYTVTINSLVPQSERIDVAEDAVTFVVTSPHSTGAVRVGLDATPDPSMILTTGTINASSVSVGTTSNATGALLSVNDDDAILATTSGSIRIGDGGEGELSITAGGQVESAGAIILGEFSGGDGLATVVGSITLPSTVHMSRLRAPGLSGDIVVGRSGQGTLRLSSLSQTVAGRDVQVGASAGSVGLIEVFNVGSLSVARNLMVGGNTTAAAAGSGTLRTFPSGASIVVGGTTSVGDANGGSGLLHINGGTLTTTGFSILAGGTLTHESGTLIVDGGPLTIPSTGLTVDSTTGSPVLDLRGPGVSNTFTAFPVSIGVGVTGQGTLHLREGRLLSGTNGSVVLGENPTGNGTLNVESGAVLDTGGAFFIIGHTGDGALTVASGGVVQAASVSMAGDPGASGSVVVDGAGSELNATTTSGSRMDVGYNQITSVNTGPATVTIQNGGAVTVAANIVFGPDDRLTITGGTLNATRVDLFSNGVNTCTMTGGTINADEFRLINSHATVSGEINARVTIGAGSSILTLNGDLTGGDPASGSGWVVNGTVVVGAHDLLLRDANISSPGSPVSLAGGTLSSTAGMVNFVSSVISGFGTIHGSLNNVGAITPSGAGLTFTGALTTSGNGVVGTRITLAPSASLTGSGVIDAEVSAGLGSVITATADLTLGRAASIGGFESLGLVVVGPHAVTLRDNGAAGIFDATINGGDLLCTTGNILLNGTLSGTGDVGGAGRTLINRFAGSRVEPNGPINCLGNYQQAFNAAGGSGGTLEINATSASGFDRLSVVGTATLGGTLEGGLSPGGVVSPGDRLTILTAASVVGTFQAVNVPDFHVEYFPTRVDLVFDGVACDPDVNQDGNVDQDDVTYLINVVSGGLNPSGIDPDFNQDGNVDQDDVSALINVIAGGACP
jgi:T5SS/PEP-CTERM-associated repeat protein